MTITRLWQAGGEVATADELESHGSSVIISTTNKKTGAYSFRVAVSGAPNSWFLKTISSASTTQCRVGLNIVQDDESTAGDVWLELVRIRDSSTNDLVEVQASQVSQKLRLVVNSTQQDITDADTTTLGTFFHLGLDCKIHSSTGWAYVYLDGDLILSFDGNTGSVNIEDVYFGNTTDGGSSGGLWYFDDIYIDNTSGESSAAVVPIKRFYYVLPNGNGNYATWVGQDSDSTDNYLNVDERPPDSDTTYNASTSADEYDSYAMNTITLTAGQSVSAVIPTTYSKREGSTEQLALGTRLSSTDSIGSDQDLGTSYGWVWERQTTKPGGGSWGQSDIDGFELVQKSRGTF